MDKVYLDGRVNGAYHKLDAGKVLINGSTYVYSKNAGAKNTQLNYCLVFGMQLVVTTLDLFKQK